VCVCVLTAESVAVEEATTTSADARDTLCIDVGTGSTGRRTALSQLHTTH